MENITKRKNKIGFSLIEIMIAIAIVGILSAVVLVSMKSYAVKGRSTKALAQVSSVIPSMISCWGNMGNVNDPSDGDDICSLNTSYGKWPDTSVGDLKSYNYGGIHKDNITDRSRKWAFSLTSGSSDDNKKICCNSTINSCEILDTIKTNCDATHPSY